MAGSLVARMSNVIESLPRRSFVYVVVALVIVSVAFVQNYTLLESLQSLGEMLVAGELVYRSISILWQAHHYGALLFIGLAVAAATLAVRSLVGGVSDDLTTMVVGFGIPVFLSVLGVLALLTFIARSDGKA